jgi:N-acetylglucosamine-6-sulfatase
MTRLLLAAFLLPAGAAQDPPRPNVVVVLVDDLRHDALGCTGHPYAKTPHIDRIGAEGAIFTNAFVTTPLCSPSRASFLTGRHTRAHGILDNTERSPHSHALVTFPALLQKAGYATGYVGKWHMGTDDAPRPGFDRWVGFKGQGVYENPTFNLDGRREPQTGYMTDLLADRAVEFVKEQRDKPFCLYVAHKAVHVPFVPAERHRGLYGDAVAVPPPTAKEGREGKPALTRRIDEPERKAPAAKAQNPPGGAIRNQPKLLAAVDDGVGRLLAALEEVGKLENTLIVFTSDNGFFWGEHGGLGDKRWAYESSIRIPFLVRWPGQVKAGTRIDAAFANIDLAPTLLEVGGAPVPETMQGKSFAAALRGGPAPDRPALFFEYVEEKQYPRTPSWEAVRTAEWKLIRYPGLAGADELYDLKADPHERKNLAADPAQAETVKRLSAELDRLAGAAK